MSKEDKQGLITLAVLIFIASILVCIVINSVRANLIKYKYFKGEISGYSNQCYVDDNDGCMCLIDNAFRTVDSYYEVKWKEQ